MDEKQILELVHGVLGGIAVHAVQMTGGQQSEVWEVTLSESLVILRLNSDLHFFDTTACNLDVLASLGLPAPRVLAAGLSLTCPPQSYLILTHLSGRDLRHELAFMTEPQMTRLAERIASFQTKVGTLPLGTGYGYVGIGGRGEHSSWWDVLGGSPDASLCLGSDGRVHELWRRVRALVAAHEPYLRSVPPTCFLDDITVKNVLVQDGELQGLVDFDCVCYGDPLYWLGLTTVGVVSDLGLLALFYVRELQRFLSLTEEQRRVSLFYAAWIALSFVERFAAGETQEWLARMMGSVADWVTELEWGSTSVDTDKGRRE